MSEKKWKKKALALSMVASMTIANPLFATGCERQYDEEEDKTAYHGTGATPFIFPTNGTISNQNTTVFTTSSWTYWTTPSTSSSYSGVHMSGFSS